ncbi:GcrA family cell cycle regulator [Mesorhizobium opportunistum]|uniref:GcrA cell cycle regulator n=1 Tax=Mesorhizobium opportunistum (strain LMG 24607 / HAMBI 3007 / WSM2075) TaxID=536019 RepID=F7XZV8_MESOW|nr:GcrA family cell cycle regulator [Mesorhizobium opportunistum]AEH88172.1 GcrA cell cycle regulator [Mesorhizobium opportunistum WSM2075]
MSEWTQDEIHTLRKLTGEGLTASQIGARMGRSRNAIIGKILRLNGAGGHLTVRPIKAGDGRPVRRPAPCRPRPPKLAFVAAKPVFERPQPYVPVANLPATLPVAFLDAVTAKKCLHFVGDPFGPDGPDMPVCGADRSEAAGTVPYCRRHYGSSTRERVQA